MLYTVLPFGKFRYHRPPAFGCPPYSLHTYTPRRFWYGSYASFTQHYPLYRVRTMHDSFPVEVVPLTGRVTTFPAGCALTAQRMPLLLPLHMLLEHLSVNGPG